MATFESHFFKGFLTGLEHLSEEDRQLVKNLVVKAFERGRNDVFSRMAEDHELESTDNE
jgi:hypothetical protein